MVGHEKNGADRSQSDPAPFQVLALPLVGVATSASGSSTGPFRAKREEK